MEIEKEMFFNDSFKEAVKLFSNKFAAIFKNEKITYGELDKRSDIISKQLIEKGIKKGCIVAIMTRRSIEMIIGIISILKAGAAYLPIDPEYPKNRKKFILSDSNAKYIIMDNYYIKEIDEELVLDKNIICINNNYNPNMVVEKIDVKLSKQDLAYVIYTSGTTGTPKGVMIGHGGLVNFINGVSEKIVFNSDYRILAVTTICFDIFILETLLSLTKGLTIVIADETEQKNPKLLGALIKNEKINMLQMTPSRIKLLLNYDKNLEFFHNLDVIIVGGEVMDRYILNSIKSNCKAKIYNMYGPTESTVWCTVGDLTDSNDINIGNVILNTEIYILNDDGQPVQDGEVGEICIAGRGLALGYINRKDLTDEKFIKCPFALGERIYKTGDIGKKEINNYVCIGRRDNQVKVKGYRVEIEEIEKNILDINIVKEVAVVSKNVDGDVSLCAYVVSDELDAQIIISRLKYNLPDYMIPSEFINVPQLPLMENGKVDRNLLKSRDIMNEVCVKESNKVCNNYDEIELKIIEKTKECLEMEYKDLDITNELFTIGMNSINFIKLIVELEIMFDIEFEDDYLNITLFKDVKSICDYVKDRVKQTLC